MQVAAFGLMCLIWGLTWLAMKAGITNVPPLLFAGTRFVVAGAMLTGVCCVRGVALPTARGSLPRLAGVTLLMVVATYGPLFWGMLFVPSGLSAVLDLAIMPMALLVIGAVLGEEWLDRRRMAAIGTGTAGLLLLFGPKAIGAVSGAPGELAGALAILASSVAYAWGSVLARPLLRTFQPEALAGTTMAGGGAALVLLAVAVEPDATHALRGAWGTQAWLGWLFLVLFGSLVAYTIYLRLLRDWGPVRAGSYAFVSPVIAVLAGVVVLHERFTLLDGLGIAAMLAGARLCVPSAGSITASTKGRRHERL